MAAAVDHGGLVELRIVEQTVTRHVGLHLGHHVEDRLRDGIVVCTLGYLAEDGVAHDHRRIGRVEDDDRLAAPGAADHLDSPTGGLGELVDIGPGARTRRLRGHRGDDLAVGHPADVLGRAGYRIDDGDGRLPAAGDHVDVRRVQILAQIGRRDHARADCRRGQVDRLDPGFLVARCGRPMDVGRGGLEHHVW